ncbi:MAG: N-acetylmuramoyl-L-alanine amidase [Alphaproteobacteria bacterium]
MLRSLWRPLFWLVLPLFASQAVGADPAVTGIRMGAQTETTRVVLDLTADLEHKIFTLPDPYRVVIDLPEVEWQLPAKTLNAGLGMVQRFRYGLFQPGVSRVVLDVSGPVIVSRAFMLQPTAKFSWRLVLDLTPVSIADFDQQAALAFSGEPLAATEPTPLPGAASASTGDKPLIVIDPGHGGIDPGTIGIGGSYEKAITLACALELRRQIEARGEFRVLLTRDRDVFVPLRQRVKFARDNGADLFISLHADALDNRTVKGATVYTLSENASDSEAAELAAKENKSDVIAGVNLADDVYDDDVAEILIDLAQRETMNLSAEFANLAISELASEGDVLRKSHRFAGFRVLKAPDVPSVLIELGYVSNPEDESRLNDPAHRRLLMAALRRAIDSYFAARRAADPT